MRQFGLIGFPLSHSFSKQYFEAKFVRETTADCSYQLFELESIDEFPAFIKQNPLIEGLNVTIPYKQTIIPFLHEVTEEAKSCGAVNCIKIENRKLVGYNTDVFGFEKSLLPFLGLKERDTVQQLKFFVLGNGGASKAVQWVLNKMNSCFVTVSRSKQGKEILYSEIETHLQPTGNVFINTTPVGMFPDIHQQPAIPYHLLNEDNFFYDLIYNPAETEFLRAGKKIGIKTKNGLEMLQLQAEKSWEIWN